MSQRKMLEQTLINLVYDMDWIGIGQELIDDELSKLSDDDLIATLNRVLENMN